MNIPFVDLKAQYLTIKDELTRGIEQVIEETAFIGGKYVAEFEEAFARMLGVKHCVGVGNGTDAIYIALRMLGIGRGDEVITVANTWISTAETIAQCGAKPVFIDITADQYTIDPDKIEAKITKNTKAIIPVHLYGYPADMDPILALAKKYDLDIVEDCAQAHLAKYKGTNVGLLSDVATFSFYPGKNLGAYGDAGCIVTNDDILAEKCRMFANHGALKKHEHKIDGINSRLDALQAAILSAKLPHLENWTAKRREVAALYRKYLHDVDGIKLPPDIVNSVYHLFVIRSAKRDELQDFLKSKGIGTSIHYPTPLPLLPVYQHLGYVPSDIPVSAEYQSQILSLPMYAELSELQVRYVCDQIREFQ